MNRIVTVQQVETSSKCASLSCPRRAVGYGNHSHNFGYFVVRGFGGGGSGAGRICKTSMSASGSPVRPCRGFHRDWGLGWKTEANAMLDTDRATSFSPATRHTGGFQIRYIRGASGFQVRKSMFLETSPSLGKARRRQHSRPLSPGCFPCIQTAGNPWMNPRSYDSGLPTTGVRCQWSATC